MFSENINIISHSIISPLGFSSAENFLSADSGKTGIGMIDKPELYRQPVCAAYIDDELINEHFSSKYNPKDYTKFEKLLILSIDEALKSTEIDLKNPDTILFLSSTKGNIELLDEKKRGNFDLDRIYLWHTANLLKNHYKSSIQPIIISNACISGVSAAISASRLLRGSIFSHAVIAGADVLSAFVLSGFQSFLALSPNVCRPFDESRNGINLGEGAGTIIISKSNQIENKGIRILGSSVSNDANHISGPSRGGDGLYLAISNALTESGLNSEWIDFVSAHGTATTFNDEMEALAFNSAGLNKAPTNSLKAYFGHTLGAAGIIESIMTFESMSNSRLIKSFGYEKHGVSVPLNIITESHHKEIKCTLKTASGFGGCNAAIIYEKI